MGEDVLKVQMLGRFTMTYEQTPISLNKTGSAKSVRLLQMLLLSGTMGIAKNELMDSLYGWNGSNDGGNRNRNLNNLIYRLKGQLVASGLPEDEYVVIQDGMCYWKSRMRVELDTEYFQALVYEARQAQGQERTRFYQRANESYYGELLPVNSTDMWFYEKSIFFKELYLETIRELKREFHSQNDYKNLLAVYERAVSIYPFENWQKELIRCNLEMYRYDEAREIYNRTMELYARELGNPPTEEMQKCFEQLELKDKNHSRSIKSVKGWQTLDKVFMGREGDITKAIFEHDTRSGAYYCAYPSFVDYCRLVVRTMARHEFTSVMMFLTLTQYEKKSASGRGDDALGQQMEILKNAIRSSLRSGDAFTRYGNRHYILMLTHIEKQNCSGVFSRIESAYNRAPGSQGELWYHASMTQELEQVSFGMQDGTALDSGAAGKRKKKKK